MSLRPPYQENEKASAITLPVEASLFAAFPRSVIWNNVPLVRKNEFHITLLHTGNAQELSGANLESIRALFNSFIENNALRLESFISDFRYVEKEALKAIIVRCHVSNSNEFFEVMNQTFGMAMPVQPPHVTLYTLEGKPGIHINSDLYMESLERVRLPELEEALSRIPRQT